MSGDEAEKVAKITAEYNADGSLNNVAIAEINSSEIVDAENTETHKVFYWETIESMVPADKPADASAQNPEVI